MARQFTRRGRNLPKPHEVRTHALKEGRYPTAPSSEDGKDSAVFGGGPAVYGRDKRTAG